MGAPLVAFMSAYRDTLRLGRYVPDSSAKRALTFFLLFMYHGAHALGRTFATALLAQVSRVGLGAFTVADQAKFQLYKAGTRRLHLLGTWLRRSPLLAVSLL